MSPTERAYLRYLMRKRDEYLAARDQEFIVPPTAHSDEVEALCASLLREWRRGRA